MKSKIFFFITAFALIGYAFVAQAGGKVSGAEARKLVDAGAQLVDVRTPAEFAEGHIKGAVNIPLQDLEARAKELQPRTKTIVVYCRSGGRSARAAKLLEGKGYTKVYDLGPMSAW